MKPKLILCLALALSGSLFGCSSPARRVSVTDIKFTFANPPTAPSLKLSQLPGAALYPPGTDGIEYGALTNIVAGRIAGLTVTYANTNLFKNGSQTRNFLRELLSSTNEQNWTYHAWSYLDDVPSAVVVVEHTQGKQGKWIIWTSPNVAWAYQDGNGKWWWGLWDSLQLPKPKSLNTPSSPE